MMRFLQILFFGLIVRPLTMIVLGLNIHNKERLPLQGPAIVAANHNSHLDALTLLSLWPVAKLHQVRPVAAADYFLSNVWLAWFTQNILGIIPIDRERKDRSIDPLAQMSEALDRGEIVVIFPEGSRGAPEQLSDFKSGISRLAERHPNVPIVPVFTHGLGKSLPKGDFLLVPFFVDVAIGQPLQWQDSVEATMQTYVDAMKELAEGLKSPTWD